MADVANQKPSRLLKEISTACLGECEGDHHSTPYQPSSIKLWFGSWNANGDSGAGFELSKRANLVQAAVGFYLVGSRRSSGRLTIHCL
jgi:hypothetical protein